VVNLADAVQVLFPQSRPQIDWSVTDDGSGPQITRWSLSETQPTNDDLAAVTLDQVDRLRNQALKISRRQGCLMLLQMDLLEQVDVLVSQSGPAAQISYESDTWYRTDPVLIQLAGVLGMSESQLAELFYQASKI
jgi:hypothetical protein